MKKQHFFLILLLIFSLSFSFLVADEGLFTPDKIKYLKLKEKGLKMPVENIFNPGKPGLQEAILLLGGGTAEFISEKGLIMTNHHVAYGSVARIATPEKNYIKDGFMAKTFDEEIQAQRYQGRILRLYEEITEKVLKNVTGEMSDGERNTTISENRTKIIEEAKEKHPGLEVNVMNVYDGNIYYLQGYFVLRDIRIVYVPPRSIGEYGGDIDNWMWPRHTGDFSFLRAYVDKDGKGAAYSKDNVPYKPVTWLKTNPKGVKENDFTMVLGYPGTTNRYKDSYNIEYQLKSNLPFLVDVLQGRIGILEEEGRKNEAVKIQFAEMVKGLNNAMKYYGGQLEAFKFIKILDKKREYEEGFKKFININPDLKGRMGNVFNDFKEIYRERFERDDINYTIRSLRYSTLVSTALNIYNYSVEKQKPVEERPRQFRDKDRLISNVSMAVSRVYPPLEKNNIKKGILRALDLPAEFQLKSLTGVDGLSKETINSYTNSIFESTIMFKADERSKLFDLSTEELAATDDIFIKIAAEISKADAEFTEWNTALNTKTDKVRRLFSEGMMKYKKSIGEDLYPDANRTFRFNYGYVKGCEPRDGMSYHPFTLFKGVIEKNTGEEPFDSPEKLTELYKNKDYGKWFDKELGDVPVCFLTDHDITGGSSGSPILDANGEFVGCAFDGTYETLFSDYLFVPEQTRTISVDVRYICFITEKFGAGFVLKKMVVDRN